MKYTIEPFVKVNKYKFEEDIRIIKGSIGNNFEEQINGNIIKIKTTDLSLSFENSILKEISIIDNGNNYIILDDLDIFKDNTVLDKLSKLYTRIDKYGFIIYNDVGIALSGFVEDEGQRTITIYSKGYWNDLLL